MTNTKPRPDFGGVFHNGHYHIFKVENQTGLATGSVSGF
jgi:hypothetical protein